jgi:hypothetical protein
MRGDVIAAIAFFGVFILIGAIAIFKGLTWLFGSKHRWY